MRAALALAGVLLASTAAHAQPAEQHEEKHAGTALVLSIGGTAAAIGVLALGAETDRPELLAGGALAALVAPSLGNFYAGEYVTPGAIIRLGGAGLALTGLVIAMSNWWSPGGTPDYAGVLAVTGGAAFLVGSAVDIANGPRAVDRYNHKHAISFSPSVMSSGGGPSGFGLSIGGSF